MVDIRQEPYFDDYNQEDNYHKILFVPKRPVQVRELNQVQSIIQKQIERVGNHIFENGSIVIPGEISYNLSYNYAKLDVSNLSTIIGQFDNPNITLEGQQSGTTAELKQYINEEGDDPFTAYVKYTSGGTSGENLSFQTNETVAIYNQNGDQFTSAEVLETGLGSSLTVNKGVYYVNGYFVRNETQTIILDKYGTTPSYKVGFDFVESAITSNEDESLVDNANGTLNFSAPGADRLQIELQLAKYDVNEDTDDIEFVEIFRIENGNLKRKARGPEYNILEDEFAKRTFYENGDFSIEPFGIETRQHPNNEPQYQVGVEEGLAFVKGREVINESTTYIDVEKARDFESDNNVALNAPLGYYIEVENLNIIPNINELEQIDLIDDSSGTEIILGTATVRALSKQNGNIALHIFNIRNTSGDRTTGFVNDVDLFRSTTATTVFEGNVVGTAEIKEPQNRKSVFNLPQKVVKTLLVNGQSDTTYEFIRQYTLQADGSGVVSINASPNEFFPIQTTTYTFAAVIDSGSEEVINDIASISTTGGSNISINFGAGYENANFRINLVVIKEESLQKTKTLTTTSKTGLLTNGALELDKADAFKINSVVIDSTSEDITDRFNLVKNTTQTYYGISYIQLKGGQNDPGENITVNFEYFQHGSGDYFTVDSYSDINYEDIPVENIGGEEVRMSDVLDFRSRIADNGNNFIDAGSSVSNIPAPNSTIQTDIEFYLPRIDKVYVTERNEFGVRKGSSSLTPKEPKEPDNAMPLYVIDLPAYTFDIDDIEVQMINNKKYSMKEIGALERRIENIEYYTALNNLEKSTADKQIIDEGTGLPRFKNGFIADPFKDHTLADVDDENYKAAISEEDEKLRPTFAPNNVDLEVANKTGVVEHENIITLPYSLNTFINQHQSSERDNVNPYAVFKYIGDVRLKPNSDQWFDITYQVPQYANTTKYVPQINTYNYWWGSWHYNWYGWNYNWWNRRHVSYKKVTERQKVGYDERTTQGTISSAYKKFGKDRIVDISVTPYMRERDITFTAKGLRPNTRVYPFFDNVDVSDYCRPELIGNLGDELVTDKNGYVGGVFELPNNESIRFRSGSRQFVLTDSPNNDKKEANAYTKTTYSAKGMNSNSQSTITSTSNIETVGTDNELNNQAIAQSFYIEGDGGVFLKELNLYFARKDPNANISVEIRNMENGFPGKKVVPYSKVTLTPDEVNTHENGIVATKFEFEDPVYLNDETEYCFVVLSSSINYEAMFADLGDRDVNSNNIISKKPFEGILFKTTNKRTWTENQTKTFKFNMKKCEFETATNGNIIFNNGDIPKVRLKDNPIATTELSSDVVVKIPDHGLVAGSNFEISGVATNAILPANNLNKEHSVVEVIDNNRVLITTSSDASETANIGGEFVKATRNYKYNSFVPYIEDLNFDKTSTSFVLEGLTSQSIDGNEVAYQSITFPQSVDNKDTHNTNQVYSVLSGLDEQANNAGKKSLTLTMTMNTDSVDVSPVVDLNRAGFTTINNIVNNPDSLDETGDGNALARYITKSVSLNNPANSIKAFVDVSRPQSSDVKMYYKTATTEDEIEDEDWGEIQPNDLIPVSDGDEFKEIEFSADGLSTFNIFQIKIVLLSSNSSNVPKIRNFRGIALGT